MSDLPGHVEVPQIGDPVGQYTHAVRDPNTGLIQISGQVAIDSSGALVGAGDVTEQTRCVFYNLGAVLRAAGSDFAHVQKLMTYLVSAEHLPAFREARRQLFTDLYPDGGYPAHTLVIVSQLSAPEHLIEIDAVATVAPSGGNAR
jgi:2-iminobutanoate/2-iminopropanoate deaminase